MNRPKSLKTAAFILMIGTIFLWLPVFMHYYGLMEADFLTSNLSYENADLELGVAGQKSQFFLWASLAFFFSWQALLYSHFHSLFFQRTFFEQNAYRLRC